jgi:protoheme IX farnesyltransferase
MLRILCEITKLPISALSTLSAMTGYVLMRRAPDAGIATVCAGVLLLAMGACALNEVQDRRIDGLMERTRRRPIPSGAMRPSAAVVFAICLTVSGFLVLWRFHNLAAALIGIFAAVWYNGIYTYLKRLSAFAVVPGALIGALPPAIGWTAAGGGPTDPRVVALCFLFFLWQVPHFWLLLFTFGDDYTKAGLPALTRIFTLRQLAGVSFIWMLATSASTLLLPAYGLTSSGWVSLIFTMVFVVFTISYCIPILISIMMLSYAEAIGDHMGRKADVWQGTLALMVLKTLETLGPLHGYGIARRIEQTSGQLLAVNYGTLYPALLKLEQEGYIEPEWGASDNNRKAKYYRLTRAGRKQVEKETREWEQATAIMARFLSLGEERR